MSEELEALRERKNQVYDGEAHLTNEELDALLDCIEAADRWDIAGLQVGAHKDYDVSRARLRATKLAMVNKTSKRSRHGT